MKHLSNPLLWLLLAFALFFLGLGAVGFVGPDEPRYADVARGMMQSGDYVTPRLFGSPWFEKPPLYYWLAAVLFRMGATEIDARLPSALSAVFFLWFWFWLSRRLFGTRAAALGCMLLGSTLGWVGFAHAAVMDMVFSATLDASLVLLAVWLWQKQEQYLYGFYILLALATLAKGPVAIVLAGLIGLAYVVTYGEWKTLGRTLYSPGLSFFVVLTLPWYVFCYQRNGSAFIQDFFIKHNFGRYTTAALGHSQPAWFYFPIIAAGLFPWTPMLLLPVIEIIQEGPRRLLANRHKMFLFCWAALTFIFFSLSKNKLPSYVLPILPPLTLWIALIVEPEEARSQESEVRSQNPSRDRKGAVISDDRGSSRKVMNSEEAKFQSQNKRQSGIEDRKSSANSESRIPNSKSQMPNSETEASPLEKFAVWLIGASALLLFTIPVGASLLGDSLATGLRHALGTFHAAHWWTLLTKGPVPPAASLLLLLPVGLCFYMLWRRDLLEAAFMVLVGVALGMLGVVQYVSPTINRVASVRTVAQRLAVLNVDGEQLAVSGLHRNQSLGLSFYMEHALPEWDPQTSPASIGYVIARDDERLPDAHPMVLFPGQHLRLWVLPPTEIQIQIEPPKSSDK